MLDQLGDDLGVDPSVIQRLANRLLLSWRGPALRGPCSSEYFGVAIGAGVAALRGAVVFALPFMFEFTVASLHATIPNAPAAIAVNSNILVLISLSSMPRNCH